MKRLTRRNKCILSHGEEIVICNHKEEDCNNSCMSILPCKWKKQIEEKLWEYENAEEQELLLRLPVAIGSIVYRINEYADEPLISMGVTSIEIKGITDIFKEMKCKECVFGGEFTYRFTDIGKTVFLSKEEAGQALAEKKGV